jgi:hypothetical protein
MWRVERTSSRLRFSSLNPVDALDDRAGNRFDIPGAGVLYGATTPQGAYAETLAAFRPRASMIAALSAMGAEPGRVAPGQVPASWPASRRLRSFDVIGALPFVDVESPITHTYLTAHAASVLVHYGVENLDVATVRGPGRLLTRAIAGWLYTRTDQHGQPQFAGIRYMSRLGDFECWAIFDGTQVWQRSEQQPDPVSPWMREVLELFALTVRA